MNPSLRGFGVLLAGLSVSLLGLSMLGFALGIWVYQHTGALTDLALIGLAASLPTALLSPLAGAVVDRGDRKRILIVGQLVIIASVVGLALLHNHDALATWNIIALAAVGAMASAFVFPALMVSIPLMVEPAQLSRANGMVSMALAIVQILGPALAGALLAAIGIKAIFLVDIATLAIGLATLMLTAIPATSPRQSSAGSEKIPLRQSVVEGWRYLIERKTFLLLILFYSVMAFNMHAITLLITPVVLGFTDERALGLISSAAGLGMLAGSALMIVWKGARNKMHAILWSGLLMCTLYILVPIWQSTAFIALCAALVMACFPVITASSQWIFQRWIDVDMQGRVFGLRNLMLGLARPAAVLIAAPLVDLWFGPAMQEGGALATLLGPVYGVGAGRGAAILISVFGFVGLCCVTVAFGSPLGKLGRVTESTSEEGTPASSNLQQDNTFNKN